MSTIGERIKTRRKELGLTQGYLADVIGTDTRQVSRYENGHNLPTSEVIIAFAKALNVSADWLLGLTNVQQPIEGNLTLDEIDLVAIYRSKPHEKQAIAVRVLEAL